MKQKIVATKKQMLYKYEKLTFRALKFRNKFRHLFGKDTAVAFNKHGLLISLIPSKQYYADMNIFFPDIPVNFKKPVHPQSFYPVGLTNEALPFEADVTFSLDKLNYREPIERVNFEDLDLVQVPVLGNTILPRDLVINGRPFIKGAELGMNGGKVLTAKQDKDFWVLNYKYKGGTSANGYGGILAEDTLIEDVAVVFKKGTELKFHQSHIRFSGILARDIKVTNLLKSIGFPRPRDYGVVFKSDHPFSFGKYEFKGVLAKNLTIFDITYKAGTTYSYEYRDPDLK